MDEKESKNNAAFPEAKTIMALLFLHYFLNLPYEGKLVTLP